MKDVANQEVQVGDTVAYCQVGYSSLKVGVVSKLTPHGVTIRIPEAWNKGVPCSFRNLNRQNTQICKVSL